MAQPRRSLGGYVPFIIISLLTLIFLIWAMRQCSSSGEDYELEELRARNEYLESVALQDSIRRADSLAALPPVALPDPGNVSAQEAERQAREAALLRARTQPIAGDTTLYQPEVTYRDRTLLYSTIDGLNVRSKPGLKSPVVARIPLYTEVYFLNEVTDSLYRINLGDTVPTAPWVRIQLKDGKQGWVYGAGVDYYKYRLEGVIN